MLWEGWRGEWDGGGGRRRRGREDVSVVVL